MYVCIRLGPFPVGQLRVTPHKAAVGVNEELRADSEGSGFWLGVPL
jgi:hypothetical protein